MKDHRATISLIEALKDDWEEVRKAAAWALGEFQDSNAAESLIEALQDSNKEVRKTAREALAKLISQFPELEQIIPF